MMPTPVRTTNEMSFHDMNSNQSPKVPSALDAIPTPVTAIDRLRSLYRGTGPYTSVYMTTVPSEASPIDTLDRWRAMRGELTDRGAPVVALDAIEARLSLPGPDDTGGIAVLADASGTTVVDHGLEPPAHDLAVVDTLPYVAPMLEWQQRRIAHLVVTVDEAGADVAAFGLDHYSRVDTYQGPVEDLAEPIASTAQKIGAELIVLVGHPADTGHLAAALPVRLSADSRLVVEPMPTGPDELTDLAVRHVSDAAARATVRHLRDQRFLAAHDAAVDGTAETVAALVAGTADRLLVHDDPDDQRRLWIGAEPYRLSFVEEPGLVSARLVDAMIRSAAMQNIPIHIIPTTGPNGPDDNAAALTGGTN